MNHFTDLSRFREWITSKNYFNFLLIGHQNSGTLEATGSGGLIIESGVDNSGHLWADGGNITVHGDVTGAGSATISGTATLEPRRFALCGDRFQICPQA